MASTPPREIITLKIQDMDTFKELVSALGAWAEEVAQKDSQTAAEKALFAAGTNL